MFKHIMALVTLAAFSTTSISGPGPNPTPLSARQRKQQTASQMEYQIRSYKKMSPAELQSKVLRRLSVAASILKEQIENERGRSNTHHQSAIASLKDARKEALRIDSEDTKDAFIQKLQRAVNQFKSRADLVKIKQDRQIADFAIPYLIFILPLGILVFIFSLGQENMFSSEYWENDV